MQSVQFVCVTSDLELTEAQDIRVQVFVEEQGVSHELELDGLDEEAEHFLARVGDQAVATARFRLVEDGLTGKIERVAVLPEFRHCGVGRAMMDYVERTLLERGICRTVLHAQVAVRDFYEGLGYMPVGDVFDEADIPHICMTKELG